MYNLLKSNKPGKERQKTKTTKETIQFIQHF